jgi:hypothetical protein
MKLWPGLEMKFLPDPDPKLSPDRDPDQMFDRNVEQKKIITKIIVKCSIKKASLVFKPFNSHLVKYNITDRDPNHLEKLDRVLSALTECGKVRNCYSM